MYDMSNMYEKVANSHTLVPILDFRCRKTIFHTSMNKIYNFNAFLPASYFRPKKYDTYRTTSYLYQKMANSHSLVPILDFPCRNTIFHTTMKKTSNFNAFLRASYFRRRLVWPGLKVTIFLSKLTNITPGKPFQSG